MKVIVNKPVPAPTPPTTYDLVGLTEDEVRAIRALLGSNNQRRATERGYDFSAANTVWEKLDYLGIKYTVTDANGHRSTY